MRSLVFGFGRSPRLAVRVALLVLATGCYGTPRSTLPDGGGRGGTGGGGTAGGGGDDGAGVAGSGGRGGRGGSAGGTGGASASGGTSAGRGGSSGAKALGQNCAGDQDCVSGHCAGNICCDQACTGPCRSCSVTGTCQMPADDPLCGTITCPNDTTCRDYATSIITNRCKASGQCKTSADCSYVDAPPTRSCGYVRQMTEIAPSMCDGQGTCASRTVKCGGDGECSVAERYCCGGPSTALFCQEAECPGTPRLGPFMCDEKADCAAGYVCCFQSTVGGPSSLCFTADLCESDAGGFRSQACNPTTTGECPTGTCQSDSSVPVGWYICK